MLQPSSYCYCLNSIDVTCTTTCCSSRNYWYKCHIYNRKAVNGKHTISGNCITFDNCMPAFLRTSTVLGIGPTLRHSLSNLTTSEVILMIMNNELWQKPGLTHVPPAWETYMLPTELFWRCLLEAVFIFNLQYVSHWLTHTLLLGTLCRLSSEHFDPQHILISGTLCFLKHFAPQYILLLGTLCFLEHFAPWNILQSVLGIKVFHEEKCAEE